MKVIYRDLTSGNPIFTINRIKGNATFVNGTFENENIQLPC